MEYVHGVRKLSLLVRRYGFDALIVVAAVAGVLGLLFRQDDPDAPTSPLWFSVPATALIVLPLLFRRRFPFAGLVFEEYNATVTLATGATETLVPAGEGVALPMGTLDTFVTYGAPANLIETVNTIGLPMYARQLARPDGSAIEVKTEASVLPVNKRPRLAVKITSSN